MEITVPTPRWSVEQTDALRLLKSMSDESVATIVTDPPYDALDPHRARGTTTRLVKRWFPTMPREEIVEVVRECYRAYRTPPEAQRAIAHWLTSTRCKIEAARRAGDALRASYVTSVTSWKILEGIWAACDRPMPPSGAVWAHVEDLCAGPQNVRAWMERLFGSDPSDRVQAAIEIVDWVVPLLERQMPL